MTAYVFDRRVTITEGDTQPYVIDYRHQDTDPETALDIELVAWNVVSRAEVMRTEATVTALDPEPDGTYRGSISGAVEYLEPGAYYLQAVLSMPGSTVWRMPQALMAVWPGPGDADVPDTPAASDLSVTLTVAGNDFAVFDPIRYDTGGGEWVRSSTGDPFATELIVTAVDGDEVTAQGSGAVTFTGGHGQALGPRWLGSGIPAITATLPASGAVERLMQMVTAEVVLISIGGKVGF